MASTPGSEWGAGTCRASRFYSGERQGERWQVFCTRRRHLGRHRWPRVLYRVKAKGESDG
jgi:hypothetical protein